jgi:hypothetical protein
MILKLTNTGGEALTIAPNSIGNGFSLSRGSSLVWRHFATGGPDASISIAPGQTITLTATWNGKPNQAKLKHVNAGTYTLVAEGWGYRATTTIKISSRGA